MKPTAPVPRSPEQRPPSWGRRRLLWLESLGKVKLTILLGLSWALGFAFRNLFAGDTETFVRSLANPAVMLVCLALTCSKRWAVVGIHLHLVNLCFVMATNQYPDGNNFPLSFWGFVLVPMLASLLLGLRGVVIYSGLSMATVLVCLFGMDAMGPRLPGLSDLSIWIGFRVSMIFMIAAISGFIAIGASRRVHRYVQQIEDIQQQAARAQDAQYAKATLLAQMSHEIRTPMNGILGMTRYLQQSDLPAAVSVSVASMASCATQLMGLLNRILDLTKLESGAFSLFPEHTDLGKEIQTAIAELSPLAKKAGVDLQLSPPGPQAPAYVDPARLRQLLGEVVEHAIRESGPGVLAIKVEQRSSVEQAHYRIHVESIAPAPQASLNTSLDCPLAQEERKEGSLGLTLAARLAKQMGGELELFRCEDHVLHYALELHLHPPDKNLGDSEGSPNEEAPVANQGHEDGFMQSVRRLRVQRLRMYCVACLALLGYYTYVTLSRSYPITASLVFVGFICTGLSMRLITIGRSKHASYAFLASYTFIVTSVCIVNGHVYAQTAWLLTLIPCMSAHLLGARAAISGFFVACASIALVVLTGLGFELRSEFVRNPSDSMIFLIIYLVCFCALAISNAWTSHKEDALLQAQSLTCQKLRREAERSNKNKDAFLANMSHEIRTPMNGILGLAEHLLVEKLSQAQEEAIYAIHRCGGHLKILLDQIFEDPALQELDKRIEQRPFGLLQVLQDTARLFEAQAQQRGLRVEVQGAKPSHLFLGDATRVLQILSNLVGNAIKFSDEGTIVVQLRLGPSQATSPHPLVPLEISVIDQGIGMEPCQCEKIFEVYQQVDTREHRERGGTGLGLPISRQLARAMGGTLRAESQPGQGSRFILSLLLPELPPKGLTSTDAPVQPQPKQRDSAPRVLVVDDNQINLRVATLQLEKLGCEVQTAENGEIAVERWSQGPWDLILMDLRMPVMDGLSATMEIRRREKQGERLPIVALTADGFAEQRQACLDAGMDEHLAKPFRSEQLAEILERFCSGAPKLVA